MVSMVRPKDMSTTETIQFLMLEHVDVTNYRARVEYNSNNSAGSGGTKVSGPITKLRRDGRIITFSPNQRAGMYTIRRHSGVVRNADHRNMGDILSVEIVEDGS